jgi:hypothetical protein
MVTIRWIAGIIGIFTLALAAIVRLGTTTSTPRDPAAAVATPAVEAPDHHQAPVVAAANRTPGARCAPDRPAVPQFVAAPAPLPVPALDSEQAVARQALEREITRTLTERVDALETEAQTQAVQAAAAVSRRLNLSADESARFGREVADLHRRGREIGDHLRSGAIQGEVAQQLLARHQAEAAARIQTLLGPARFALLDQITLDEPAAPGSADQL